MIFSAHTHNITMQHDTIQEGSACNEKDSGRLVPATQAQETGTRNQKLAPEI